MAPVLQEVLAANEVYAASFGDKGKLVNEFRNRRTLANL